VALNEMFKKELVIMKIKKAIIRTTSEDNCFKGIDLQMCAIFISFTSLY